MAAENPSLSDNEVLAYCGACKMDLVATIVAKVGSKIVKVQCNTCKKERAFKAPKGVTEPGAAPTKVSKTGTGGARKKKPTAEEEASAKAVAVESEWNRLMGEAAAANRVKYSPKAKLALGDVVQHPMFGDGVVMRIQHPDKAEIIFQKDVKLLIHSRA